MTRPTGDRWTRHPVDERRDIRDQMTPERTAQVAEQAARYPRPRRSPAHTTRDQWADFDAAEARIEHEEDNRR